MQRGDVVPGDDVKNSRTDGWGRVEQVDCDGVTGKILRFYVAPLGNRYGRLRWWLASSISMVEKARKEAK